MKIAYLGTSALHQAISKLIQQHLPKVEVVHLRGELLPESVYQLLIADSHYFNSLLIPNRTEIHCPVVILGHYTDPYAHKAFQLNENFHYLPYSQLEQSLTDYIDSIVTDNV